MSTHLYRDSIQARRVTSVAQRGLATIGSGAPYADRRISIAPEILRSTTVALWTLNNLHLHHRAVALVEGPCKRNSIEIETLGEYPLFTGTKLVRGSVTDVVIVPANEDPLIKTGLFPLPQQVHRRLRAMQKAGVPFDRLQTYIAHEVPRNSVSADGPIPLEVIAPPAPASVVHTSQRLGEIAYAATVTFPSVLSKMAFTGIRDVSLVSAGTGVAAAILLDPLIFAALPDERGIATWFVLAQWAW